MAAADDPAYQAYLKALGFDEALARQDATLQTTQAQGQARLAKPELMAQGGERREGISDSFEDRGMFLSSERLRDLASQRRGEQYQLALIDKGAADSVADIDMALQRQLASIGQQRTNAQIQHDAWLAAQGGLTPEDAALSLLSLGFATQQRPTAPSSRFG